MKILFIFIIILGVVVLGIILLGLIFSAPAYKGPVSDHFDGKKFHNPGNVEAKGFRELFRFLRERDREPWTEVKNAAYGQAPVKNVNGDEIKVTYINHSSFLIQTGGKNMLLDPVWSNRASPVPFAGPKRMRPPGIRFEDLPEIDIVLLSHNHYDHLDIITLKKIWAKDRPEIFCPLGVGLYLAKKGIGNITEMDWWDEKEIGAGLTLVSTPAQHFSGRGMFDRDRTLWCGFAFKTTKGTIYYSGDTGFGEFFHEIAERISPVRLAFLPIGAYRPAWFMAPIHTSPEDAIKIHNIIKSPKSIAMHYGTFPLANDGMEEPPRVLRDVMERDGMDSNEFIVLQEGESLDLKSDG